eukprot:5847913-Amphidinium_carterae.1
MASARREIPRDTEELQASLPPCALASLGAVDPWGWCLMHIIPHETVSQTSGPRVELLRNVMNKKIRAEGWRPKCRDLVALLNRIGKGVPLDGFVYASYDHRYYRSGDCYRFRDDD